MKKMILACLCMLFFSLSSSAQKLTITVKNITEHVGTLKIGVYDEEGYMKTTLAAAEVQANKDEVTVTVNLPRAGKYAVAVFQDKNGNNKLDSNFLGIPNEPFGFSNLKSFPMGSPKFKTAAFDVEKDQKIIVPLFDSIF
ncbi:MAG: DUF2141 domain-containing protein [Bacteroidaceae bacterium]|nr:DUF2141 domain-containing protein [Bacteroidaceae bacterium]